MNNKLLSIDRSIISKYVLVFILLLAGILRLWHLGSIPPGLTPDEAALGYNAYSILSTGRDEFGKFFPIVFKSFGDYKPGLYVYLTIPSVALLGLSEFSTRLPSALAGVVSVFLIYLIIGKLNIENLSKIKNFKLEIIAALVAATNPYLIYFSRGAWEANVSLTLTLAGIYFFLRAIEDGKYLVLSILYFVLTILTYQGAKLSTAIVLTLLILIYWKDFWKIKLKYLITSFVLGIILSVPIILTLFNGQTQRLAIFSVFSYPRPQSEIQAFSGSFFNLFNSNQLYYSRMVLSRWFNFYSGKFLLFEGDLDNPVHTAPYQGVLLLADLIALPIGLFEIFKKKISKATLFILLWLLFAPFSAAISRDQTNAVRSLNTAIPLVVVISIGLVSLINWIQNQKLSTLYYILLSTFYIFSFVYFLDAYFIHVPAHNSNYWRYGYKEAISYITPIESKYNTVVFEQSFNQPYIYFLFYLRYSPAKWQSQANLVNSKYIGDVGFETKLDNIQFERVDWSALQFTNNTLVITGPTIPPEVRNNPTKYPIIHEIKYLNNRDTAFDIIEVR